MEDKEIELFYANTLKRMAFGPGAYADIIADSDPDNEIMLSTPRSQYVTGALYPKQMLSNIPAFGEAPEDSAAPDNKAVEDGAEDEDEPESEDVNGSEEQDNAPARNDTQSFDFYYGNSMGLSCKLHQSCAKLRVTFSYGTYHDYKGAWKNVKIRFSEEEWTLLQQMLKPENGYLKQTKDNVEKCQQLISILHFKDGTLWADQQLKEKTLIYAIGKKGSKSLTVKQETVKNKLLLLFKERFQRKPFLLTKESNICERTEFEVEPGRSKCCLAVYSYGVNKILKILLLNTVEGKDGDKTVGNVFYQTHLSVEQLDENGQVLPVPAYDENKDLSLYLDQEQQILEHQYQDVKSYARGAFCSVTWNESHTMVETTYLPEENVKDQSVNNREDQYSIEPEILSLRNLSIWGSSDEKLLDGLAAIVNQYEKWHKNQADMNGDEDMQVILDKQERHRKRLQENLDFLRTEPSALLAFRLANTAMYLQMVISRDKRFSKDHEVSDFHRYNDIAFFRDYDNAIPTSYRPFQLAFLLMNVKTTYLEVSPEAVDLIWFKTGGGKTEAYLALTALTIIVRKMKHPENSGGVSVIMRYTLRLLASQQFERASYLICALEFLRRHQQELEPQYRILGNQPITSGMWVGSSVTPNSLSSIPSEWQKIDNAVGGPCNEKELKELRSVNTHPITNCPWCGHNLISLNSSSRLISGYEIKKKKNKPKEFSLCCVNEDCCFHDCIPIDYIDEQLYREPPTLLFATVDKFAQISFKALSRELFYQEQAADLSPDLIIQDELHLISGPLGSTVAFFENIVDELSTHGGTLHHPKIIASTATIRNADHLIKQLYQKDVDIFPPLGIRYDDNFYAHPQKTGKRNYIGFIPTGGSSANAEVVLIGILFYAKLKLLEKVLDGDNGIWKTGKIPAELDNYWTFLCYYNSLKDLGSSRNRVPQEIREQIRVLMGKFGLDERLYFAIQSLEARTDEFTSRVDSTGIKALLNRAETPVALQPYERDGQKGWRVDYQNLDLALASNMISVGIDISRFNIMLFAGQPRSFSEYIQSSSRIARQHDGLVINLLNPIRSRELSIFESFRSYHQAYYKYVEPLSVTPFTENVIDRLLNSVFVAYFRHIRHRKTGGAVTSGDIEAFEHWICARAEKCNLLIEPFLKEKIALLSEALEKDVEEGHDKWDDKNGILQYDTEHFSLMQSLRDVAPDAFLRIISRTKN